DNAGKRTEYTYDKNGNRQSVKDVKGNTSYFWYDADKRMVASLDAEGYLTSYQYDSADNRTGMTQYANRYSGSVSVSQLPQAVQQAMDRSVVVEYDKNNHVIAQTTADHVRSEFVNDGAGNKVTDKNFVVTTVKRDTSYSYDNDGRLLSKTTADGATTSYTYDGAGRVITEQIQKTGETIKLSRYAYDLDGHLISTTLDPSGLAITQTQKVDDLGNVLESRDGEGRLTTRQYDAMGRLTLVKDVSGNVLQSFAYDISGNVTSEYGKDGHKTYTYDANNHRTSVTFDSVAKFELESGYGSSNGLTTMQYDAVGNVIQITNAAGFKTTNYYNRDNRLIAQLDTDNVLHEFDYDAFGDKIAERMYMTRLDKSAQDPAARPVAPAGEVRVYGFEFDVMGRQVRKLYPQVVITHLGNSTTSNPTASQNLERPEETARYDAAGNVIESVAVNGSHTYGYYDAVGRLIAQVDALGYLTRFDYDKSGNMLQKRMYTAAIDLSKLDPSKVPVAVGGKVATTTYVYDAANRLVEQRTPATLLMDQDSHTETITTTITRYRYDKSGNLVQKTVGAGSSVEQAEFNYYDSRNRLIANVSLGRALTLYSYDDQNRVQAKLSYVTAVPGSVDLASVAGNTTALLALVAANPGDKATRYTYDARGQVTSEAEAISQTSASVKDADSFNIVFTTAYTKNYQYDAMGNRTLLDDNGHVTRSQYDAANRVTHVVAADGTGSRQAYDAAGNVTHSVTGERGNEAIAATNVHASLSDGLSTTLNISYHLNALRVPSYVVWDSASHAGLDGYANKSGLTVNGSSLDGYSSIQRPAYNSTTYYRVVTQDTAGNLAYSEEIKVEMPPEVQDVKASVDDYGQIHVKARFGPGINTPTLIYGPRGATNTGATMSATGDGYYEGILPPGLDPNTLAFRLGWANASGVAFASTEQNFEAPAKRQGSINTLSEVITDKGVLLKIDSQMLPLGATNISLLTAKWRVYKKGVNDEPFAATGNALDNGQYHLVLGDTKAMHAGIEYEILIEGVDKDGKEVIVDHMIYKMTGDPALTTAYNTVAWSAPPDGDSQVIIVKGQPVPTERLKGKVPLANDPGNPGEDDRVIAHLPLSVNSGSVGIYYTNHNEDQNQTGISSSKWMEWFPVITNGVDNGYWVHKGYDLNLYTILPASDSSRMATGLHFSWNDAATGGLTFANDFLMEQYGGGYKGLIEHIPLPAKAINYKVWYRDAQGQEVIVDWYKANTNLTSSHLANSETVQATETSAAITGLVMSNGHFNGGGLNVRPAAEFMDTMVVASSATGQPGGKKDIAPGTAGYSRDNRYNAMNALIGSSSDDHVWRNFGVDAAGHAIETDVTVTEGGNAVSTSYAHYDALGRQDASYTDSFTTTSIVGGSPVQSLQRSVTRQGYDYAGNVNSRTDAAGNISSAQYDEAGRLASQTDALGHTKTFHYDAQERLVATTDENGHTSYLHYDLSGQVDKTTDATGHSQQSQHDAFGRTIHNIDGNANYTDLRYDQRDHLLQQGDTEFELDAWGQRIAQHDTGNASSTSGHRRQTTYDEYGRVTSVTEWKQVKDQALPQAVTTYRSYDSYGNLIAEVDGNGKGISYQYDGFARLIRRTDQAGHATVYTYDEQGRQVKQTGTEGQNIDKRYDNAGNLIQVADSATGTQTDYGYNLMGQRTQEKVHSQRDAQGQAHDRDVRNEYDALGRLTGFSDVINGVSQSMQYDAVGNRTRVYGSGGGASADHISVYDAADRLTSTIT
ncbi:MAG: hypothetical protein V4495_16085, partial [Pseudomonadota bacterium]